MQGADHRGGRLSTRMDRPDDPAFWPEESAFVDAVEGWITPEEVEAQLDALEAPGSELVDLGVSLGGRPLTALRISGPTAPLYSLRIFGGHHGDEPISVLVALTVAERLVSDPALIPEGAEVWVVPDGEGRP